MIHVGISGSKLKEVIRGIMHALTVSRLANKRKWIFRKEME